MNNFVRNSHTPDLHPDSNPPLGDDATILLVDATPTAEEHATELEQTFNRVITAETVSEAQNYVEAEEIDCIVSEYELPGTNGLQLLETIRGTDPDLPFVIWTGSGDETIASDAIAVDVTDYIPKSSEGPPNYGALEKRLRVALTKDRSGSREPNYTLTLFSDVCEGLTEAESTDDAVRLVLRALCEHTDWKYGEVWTPNDQEEHLTCLATSPTAGGIEEFARLTESVTFEPGEGLPGRVWATGSEEWITDISHGDPEQYVRTVPAEIAGLDTVFAAPIRVNTDVEGVLVCYLTESKASNPRLREIVTIIGGTLGRYIAQQNDERAIERQRQRDLTERTKELKTIHHTVELLNSQKQGIDEILTEFVRLLPPGFQYPNTTAARIIFGTNTATTGGFEPDNDRLTASTETKNGTSITLEVAYLREHPSEDHGPFLQEERELLETLATILKAHCDERESRHQLEESESRYRTLTEDVLESMDVGVFILDSDFTIEWANTAVADYFGLHRDEIIGRDKRQLLSESIRDVVADGTDFEERICASYENNSHVREFELHVTPGKNRDEQWLAHWSKPITEGEFEGGRIEQYTNITELKQTERSLHQARSRIELALETTDRIIWEWDPESDHVLTYPETHTIFDSNVETVDDFLEEVHSEDRELVESALESALDSGQPYSAEFRVERNGEIHWIADYGEIHRDESGNSKLVGVATDITQRKTRDQELNAQRERFRAVFDGAFDAMVLADDDGNYTEVNDSAATLFRCSKDDLIGKSIADFAPEDVDFQEAWSEFNRTGHERGRFRLVRPDETERIVEFGATADIVPGEHLSILRDVTERVEREKEFRQKHENLRRTEQLGKSGGWVYNLETETLHITDGTRRLFGLPKEHGWTLEESFEYYHPEDRELLTRSFERCRRAGASYDIEVRIITPSGHQRWVHERADRVTEDGVKKVRGAVRDITEERRHREALSEINTATRALLHAESDAEIAQTTVEAASQILAASGVAVYLYDCTAEALVPVARSDDLDSILGELPRFDPGEGLAWRAFTERKTLQFDDVRTADDVYDAGTPIRSELLIPIGEHGVLLIGDTEVEAFGTFTEKISETLVAAAEAALDRAEQIQQLREQQREAQVQATRLERVEHLNDELRTIIKAVIEAGSRDAIKQIVCDSIADLPAFSNVWIGEMNHATDHIEIGSRAGAPEQYLQDVSLDVHDENSLPVVQACDQREPVVASQIGRDPTEAEWRTTALVHDIRSICSLPIIHNDVLYGVLTLHSSQSDVFDEITTKVLAELAELVGFALQTINQRNALLSDEMVSLTCRITGGKDLFIKMAMNLQSTIHVENISVHSEETYLAHFRTDDVDPDEVIRVSEEVASIGRIECISTEKSPLFEAEIGDGCIAVEITEFGASLHSAKADEDRCIVELSVPANRDISEFVEYLTDRFASVDVIRQRRSFDDGPRSWLRILDKTLTDRQLDLLRTAYYSGYFNDPRERTGVEIAEAFDISQPSFSKQLRGAQQKLLRALLT